MKYFNVIVVMVILFAFQWNAVLTKSVVVKFASDAGQLYLYNSSGDIKDITNCRLDLTNKNVICHVYYQRNVKTCDNDPLNCFATYSMDYDLRMPITKFTGSSCTLTNGTTFKSSKLMAVNENNHWVQAHALCNYKIVMQGRTPYLPNTMTPSTSQRFDFVTSNDCRFSAYYDQVQPYNNQFVGVA